MSGEGIRAGKDLVQNLTYDKSCVVQRKKKRKCVVLEQPNTKRARLMEPECAEKEQRDPDKKVTRGEKTKYALGLHEELVKLEAYETTQEIEPEGQGGSSPEPGVSPQIQVPVTNPGEPDHEELMIVSIEKDGGSR